MSFVVVDSGDVLMDDEKDIDVVIDDDVCFSVVVSSAFGF